MTDLFLPSVLADFGTKVEKFKLGVEAAVPYGKLVTKQLILDLGVSLGINVTAHVTAENCRMMKNVISGVMYLTFTNPEPNMLRFVTEERRKGWEFESNLTFSPMGKSRNNTRYTCFTVKD